MKSFKSNYATRFLLFISGLLAAGIAATILLAPDVFYAGYGIDVSSDASLANELKAPAGVLLIAGLLMLTGVLRADCVRPSLAVGAVIYLSYGLSRLFSILTDGTPHDGLIMAAVIELVIGTICLADLKYFRGSGQSHRHSDRGSWAVTCKEESA